MNEASTSVAVSVTVPRERFFYWFLSADLPKIMQAYAILPGVASTRNQTGPMHQVGVSRQILFLDGTSAVEEITDSAPPRSLDYRVHSLTSAFHYLVRDGTARIVFSASSPQETTVEWRYTFQGHTFWPRSSCVPSSHSSGEASCARRSCGPSNWPKRKDFHLQIQTPLPKQ